ncbi:translation initiation factor eIF-2B subunit beta [Neocloeon triangulifer]|uniref:translation initiation factor eIF-2B subunit beta n=1 Tax=Neocloeon triangulifer TaxID=2078957 RepID=UPI00286EE7EC|nr:translation initiation factor eIF-2B subunit beta [Neocloeon triangulifer]
MRELTEARNMLVFNVKHGNIQGSLDVAKATADFVSLIASSNGWTVASELLRLVNEEGNKLIAALPLHVTVANVLLQLLHIIRVEYLSAVNKSTQAVQRFVESCMNYEEKFSAKCEGLKEAILDHIGEYQTDLELAVDNITEQAIHQIQPGDVIMTIGRSSIVEAFLLAKAREKNSDFEVVVAEGAPQCEGQKMAESLAKKGVPTTLIPDTNIFAFMPRVTKVILGTNLVLRSGGLRALPGAQIVCLVAHDHKVPVIVVAPTYKFSRMLSENHLADNETFNLLASPEGVVSFKDGFVASKVKVLNPMYDFVPPNYVSQVVSNLGTYGVSQMFTAISELYGTGEESAEDLRL